jgi:hypothetical protein
MFAPSTPATRALSVRTRLAMPVRWLDDLLPPKVGYFPGN